MNKKPQVKWGSELPESIDWPRPVKPSRPRRGVVFFVLAVIAVIVFSSRTALSYWVDLLWFRSLGYSEVFWKSRGLEWTVFAAFAMATFLYLFGVFSAFKRAHSADLPDDHTIVIGGNPIRLPVAPVIRAVAFGVSLVIALVTAAAIQAKLRRPDLWQPAQLLSLYSSRMATYYGLATHAGYTYLHPCRRLHPHNWGIPCHRRPLPHQHRIALARTFSFCRSSTFRRCHASLYKPV